MVESCASVMDAVLSNARVEPRRKITCSIVSFGCSFFRRGLQSHSPARRSARRNDRLLPAPLSYFLYGRKRRRIVHLKHGGIFDLALREGDRFQAECMSFTGGWGGTVCSVPR